MNRTIDHITPESVLTLPGLMRERVRRSPGLAAYLFFNKTSSSWQTLSWQEMYARIGCWYRALKQENLRPGDRVALMLANGPEWICFDQAALALGLVVVPLFANDRPENIAYILEETETRLLLCPGLAYWNDLEPVLDRLEGIHRIVTLDFCRIQDEDARIVCSTDWLPAEGEEIAIVQQSGDRLATIVYTSGTTGMPKGVMLTHRSILENSYAGLQAITIYSEDLFLSFLPLSHMLERTVGYYLPVMAGATVAFSRSIPQLGEDLLQLRPTALVAVPRIFERIHGGIRDKLAKGPAALRWLCQLAVTAGWQRFCHEQGRAAWSSLFLLLPILDLLVARKVRERLGGRLRVIISGGAPLAGHISRFFIGLGLPLYQGYGLTETSPVVSVNREDDNDPSGVGPPLPGVEIRIGENDELLVKGSCVMQGYWRQPAATAATIDDEGWLHTGDKVQLEDGHIHITGRLKDILVLSNSEKVAPAELESAIGMDPLFEQSMVVGEGRPYLTLLAVVNQEQWQRMAATLNLPPEPASMAMAVARQEALRRIEKQLHAFPGYAWIKEVTLLTEPWTVENGLLTPTLKMKRERILAKMRPQVERMYGA